MDRKLIGILASGVAIMGLSAVLVSLQREPEIPKKERHYMHCPECMRESRYKPLLFEKDCPYCGAKGPMVATKDSLRQTGQSPSWFSRALPFLLVEVTVLGAVVYWYASRKLKQVEDEYQLYMECDRCHQRLRYKLERVGQPGVCPRCKRGFRFPELAPDEDEEEKALLHWWQPRWWLSR